VSVEEQAQLARTFVSGIVDCLGLAASTSVEVTEETIEVAVDGDSLGLLIGPHGATLGALQELTRTAVQTHSTEHSARIIVDVAGYRAKRAAALAQFAGSVAEQVLETGRPHSLEPMSAADRKLVHDTVNEIPGVRTSSEGVEGGRHVVVHPDPESAGHVEHQHAGDDAAEDLESDAGDAEDGDETE